MTREPTPSEAEHLLLEYDKGISLLPADIAYAVVDLKYNMVPTGVGYAPGFGLFVLQSSGQGPYYVWKEWGSNYGKENYDD